MKPCCRKAKTLQEDKQIRADSCNNTTNTNDTTN